ncbi:hypothetical protein LTR36_010598 [Oleoguttula mirabilis]|uniref:Uncharacterized protein n=1 Tax=Oleoguttula mirabilis TaxID=1507867 RepID=A0AAV9JQJ8_9PEZI|nr:hypothetical protein LTR36_010598 [Oleoguttula mirabilis]
MAASSRPIATASSAPTPRKANRSPESHVSLDRRNAAAWILQSYEKLSWWSFQRCESMTQTRLHFQNIVAGFTPEDEAGFVDWKEDFSPHPPKAGEEQQARASRKGKERASLGGGGEGGAGPSSPVGGSNGKGKARETVGNGAGSSGAAQTTKKKRKSGGGGGGGGGGERGV